MMAYGNTFPVGYPPYFMQGYGQQAQQPPQQPITQPQNNAQMQNGGFMVVPSEDIARTYPVAPGNCVTFKIEGKPIVMEKSMGFSQLEAPRIDRYRLIREEDIAPEAPKPNKTPDYEDEIKRIWDEINVLKEKVEEMARTEDSGA